MGLKSNTTTNGAVKLPDGWLYEHNFIFDPEHVLDYVDQQRLKNVFDSLGDDRFVDGYAIMDMCNKPPHV